MALFARKSPVVGIRGIHLDLKGVPPTPARHLEVLDLMAAARLNCALVEWEDSYPWTTYPELRSATAYAEAHVRRFMTRAARLGIRVIPLVQCFGHMENLLLKKRFHRLRELPDDPRDVCPSRPETRQVIRCMIEDVLRTHGGRITHFHLGGDEAWSLGSCSTCKRFVKKHGKAALYLHHVVPLLEFLGEQGIRPILWDDMMRGWSLDELRRIAPLTDLMAWSYANDPFAWLKRETLDRYAAAGVTVWGASSFKGGDGATTDLPNVKNRAANMLAWAAEAKRRPIAGIVATGWSRYNVCLAPCESLEVSLDTLVLAGATAWDARLPREYAAEAREFLHSRRWASVAGERFDRCLAAAQALHDWRQRFAGQWSFMHAEALAPLAGEPERRNEREYRQAMEGLQPLLRHGVKLGREFVRAHAGLIPRVWLERYITSRLKPVEDRVSALPGQWRRTISRGK